jgi:hypothetical protein
MSRSITYLGNFCETKRSYDLRMHIHNWQFWALERLLRCAARSDTVEWPIRGPNIQKRKAGRYNYLEALMFYYKNIKFTVILFWVLKSMSIGKDENEPYSLDYLYNNVKVYRHQFSSNDQSLSSPASWGCIATVCTPPFASMWEDAPCPTGRDSCQRTPSTRLASSYQQRSRTKKNGQSPDFWSPSRKCIIVSRRVSCFIVLFTCVFRPSRRYRRSFRSLSPNPHLQV